MNTTSWQPTASAKSLVARSEICWRIRDFFHQSGFVEVHTPTLSRDTVVDRHIDPIRVSASELGTPGTDRTYYLQTSPEFCMKRLVASGLPAIYQICPAFRASEQGAQHNPEFTMVEWYRAGEDQQAGINLLTSIVKAATQVEATTQLTYRLAFSEHVGADPFDAPVEQLARVATERIEGVTPSWGTERDDWLNLLFSHLVQPNLGHSLPAVVTNYPATQSALARISDKDPATAERFELFWRGIELANGYHELTNASELEQRNVTVNRQRQADGNSPLPSESGLLRAMHAGFPNCAGCALGLDRLVMATLGENDLASVIAFPIDRA